MAAEGGVEDPHSSGEETEEKPVSDKNPASTVESSSLEALREVTAEEEAVRSGHQLNSFFYKKIKSAFLMY